MSGFFGSNETSKWGGFLKQAISNVETTFDSLLEAPPNNTQQTSKARGDGEMETETYMDPISGMVTTIEKPKTVEKPKIIEKPKKADVPRTSSDLSARLAAVMQEKKSPHLKELAVSKTNKQDETPDKQPSSTSNSIKDNEEIVEEKKSENNAKENVKDVENIEKEESVTKTITQNTGEALDEEQAKGNEEQVVKEETVVENKKPEENKEPEEKKEVKENPKLNITKNGDQEEEKEEKKDEKLKNNTNEENKAKSSKDVILEQREQQLFQAMENIAKLHDQIHQLQEKENVYTSHISELEEKIAQHEQENSNPAANTQKNVKRLEAAVEDLKKQITMKDEKIQGLLQEGEKLSKTELKHSTTIKKLRQEKAEQDKTVADLQKKLEKATTDLTESTQKGTKQSENEKRLQESVKLLSDLTEQQTKHINKLEAEKIANKEKQVDTELALQNALDNIEKEKAKAKSEAESASSAALEKEIKANDRLHKELTKAKEDADTFEAKLRKEIRELQIAMQTLEEQAGNREDHLRQEVQELQTKLQQSDNRIDDISSTVDEATAPLLRQIEDLQTQHAAAIKHRDQTEKSMILRMQSAELERSKTVEKQAKLQSELTQVTERLTKAELEVSVLEKENEELKEQLKSAKASQKELQEKIDTLTKENAELANKETQNIETLKSQYQRLMKERLNEERKQFEIKLKTERAKFDNRSSSQLSIAKEEETAESTHISSNNSISSRSSFETSSASHAVSSILVERLQANIRQLENQLSFYQTQLQSSSQSRDELSEEVLSMSIEIEDLRKKTKKASETDNQLKELNGRYQTLLELLGERTEQVEELKADLNDVKEMYRNQIVELVQKIDTLSKK